MRLSFCSHHIVTFLARLSSEPTKPLDLALSEYLRQNKSIGAHDRRLIGETIYGLMRWKELLDYLCPENLSLADRLKIFQEMNWAQTLSRPSIPEALRLGFTEFLFEKLKKAYGLEKARKLAQVFLTPAPTTIRANRIKTTREELLVKWANVFLVAPSEKSPDGIVFSKREPLFSLPEFKEGLFEMQDEGSQLVAALVRAESGQHILDYCSGSGGKTLAFAPAMKGKGQIYLHDVRPTALLQAKQRLRRAGVQNAQFLSPDHPKLPQLKGKMDWVLVDVPCSGSGTLRRHPEMKGKIDQPFLDRIKKEQQSIFEKALRYVRPGGRIVYATCSILPEENEEQTDFFEKRYDLIPEGPSLSILPEEGKMDGFFAKVFQTPSQKIKSFVILDTKQKQTS